METNNDKNKLMLTLTTHAETSMKRAETMVVETKDDLKTSADVLKFIKDKIKAVKEQKKNFTDPIKESIKNIEAPFDALLLTLNKADETLRKKVLDSQRKIEKEEREAAELKRKEVVEFAKNIANEQREQGNNHVADAMERQLSVAMEKPLEVEKTRGEATGAVSSIVKRFTYEVTDVMALMASRPDLVTVEPIASKIRAEVNAGAREIAGIRIFETESLRVG